MCAVFGALRPGGHLAPHRTAGSSNGPGGAMSHPRRGTQGAKRMIYLWSYQHKIYILDIFIWTLNLWRGVRNMLFFIFLETRRASRPGIPQRPRLSRRCRVYGNT